MNAKAYRQPTAAQARDTAATSTTPLAGADGRRTHARHGATAGRRSEGRLGAWTTIAVATAIMSLTSGCAYTLVAAADAVGSVTQAGFAVASQVSSPTYVTGKALPVKHVCIEINNQVNLSDLVPALRVALAQRGVTSMVYNAGTAPPDCESRLTYTASMDYGQRQFIDGYTRYLSTIDLRLVHGTEVVVAHYQTEGLNVDRFASVSTKMRGLVRQMVVPVQNTQLAAVPISRSSGYTISTNGQTSYSAAEVMAVPLEQPGMNALPNAAPTTQANPYGTADVAMSAPAATPPAGYVSPYTGTRAAPATNPPAFAGTQPAQAPYAGDAPMPAPATQGNPYGTTSSNAWKPKGITSTSP
ncbi:hypothetical protein [Robbsia andropogonis]|uniref:hypothetical protein n=1 Tax=Robbsia andropogonis TaxID=28092 RepID=UPI000464C923|nr:hypothetical protein [Robbsia andropogonis]MCP1117844.1 hypothetical protein [Robbsia andropogonis]MCP1127308.1 hypothetical protein [Robbsia andropogonis]